ncbi:hypothetical protein RRG08_012937 [Elysia crispata]|uniref:Uncharacterized protein n=1 Tax=Elysia crispata TaxID=231223 RepID=A0AAE1DR61_9GAST|nr:hypothetical protein RRG08_012937 [Elysia crispata]
MAGVWSSGRVLTPTPRRTPTINFRDIYGVPSLQQMMRACTQPLDHRRSELTWVSSPAPWTCGECRKGQACHSAGQLSEPGGLVTFDPKLYWAWHPQSLLRYSAFSLPILTTQSARPRQRAHVKPAKWRRCQCHFISSTRMSRAVDVTASERISVTWALPPLPLPPPASLSPCSYLAPCPSTSPQSQESC